MPLPVVLVDKENGGKSDAINAGVNVSQYPYFMATDADMIIESEALIHAARHFVEDRAHTVAVGGNVRPLNGSKVRSGSVSEVKLPRRPIEMVQVVEYIRSFLAARPGWSAMRSLLIVSGAFGIFQKLAVVEVGGFRNDHLGEDMEMTMRLHRHNLRNKREYRIVYAPDAVAWTEVPSEWAVLRKQRIRWHRGFVQVIWQYRGMIFNPRYGRIGLVGWPSFVAFEFIAPIVEFLGWLIIPLSIALGYVNVEVAIPLAAVALLLGAVNSVVSLFLDDRFGYYDEAGQTLRLLLYSLTEHLGLRQRSTWWRFRSMFWNPSKKVWGDMQRTGVGNLAGSTGAPGRVQSEV
jgi:cellulose synthase/poly-beta-1,6-N-acetylglucosamine synthase-like glycosyltransferase